MTTIVKLNFNLIKFGPCCVCGPGLAPPHYKQPRKFVARRPSLSLCSRWAIFTEFRFSLSAPFSRFVTDTTRQLHQPGTRISICLLQSVKTFHPFSYRRGTVSGFRRLSWLAKATEEDAVPAVTRSDCFCLSIFPSGFSLQFSLQLSVLSVRGASNQRRNGS